MTTASFLAEPHAMLHIPRCVKIAQYKLNETGFKNRKRVAQLIKDAEEAEYQFIYGASYTVDESGWDARLATVNAAGTALLEAVGEEYT